MVHQLEQPLRPPQTTQDMLAQVDELHALGQLVADELLRRQRDDNLTSMRHRHQPSRTIQHRPVIVPVALLGAPGMQTHTHPNDQCLPPRLARQPALSDQRRLDRLTSRPEHRMDPVAQGLHHTAAVVTHRRTQDLVVASQGRLHRRRKLIPQPRRILHIGKQERHRPRRQLPHDTPSPPVAHDQVNQTTPTAATCAAVAKNPLSPMPNGNSESPQSTTTDAHRSARVTPTGRAE
jgi:hypothetical protein